MAKAKQDEDMDHAAPDGPAEAKSPFGRRATRREAIETFLDTIDELSGKPLELFWQSELEAIARTRTFGSGRVYVTQLRNAIKERFGDQAPALAIVTSEGLKELSERAKRVGPPLPSVAPALAAAPSEPPPPATAEERVERATINTAGRIPTLQTIIVAFMQRLRSVDSETELIELWDAELERHKDRTPATLKNYITKYRNEIRLLYGEDHFALDVVKAPQELTEQVNAEYLTTITNKHRRQVGILHWREIVSRARELIALDDPMMIGIGLLVLTGRRPIEVFCYGSVERQPLSNGIRGAFEKWAVSFSGQAKTKGRRGTMFGQAFPIPVLAPAAEIIAAWRRMRSSPDASSLLNVADRSGPSTREVAWEDMNGEDFNRSIQTPLGRHVQRLFIDLWPDSEALTATCFRALYAEIAYRTFATPQISQNSYYAAVLGHTEKDLETSLSYIDYYLADEEEKPQEARIERLQGRIKARFREVGIVPDQTPPAPTRSSRRRQTTAAPGAEANGSTPPPKPKRKRQ